MVGSKQQSFERKGGRGKKLLQGFQGGMSVECVLHDPIWLLDFLCVCVL